MILDTFNLFFLNFMLFFIYGSICIVSTLFTFFLDTYRKIDETLNLDVFITPFKSPLDREIDFFNVWLTNHNRIVGPILILISLVDLKFWFDFINTV
jgi:hypothetical protein